MLVQQHLNLLGLPVQDRITGIKGVVTSVCFDLYGCIQAAIHPGVDKSGKQRDVHWYDVSRLKVLKDKPIIDRPNFVTGPQAEGKQGPAEKPSAKV